MGHSVKVHDDDVAKPVLVLGKLTSILDAFTAEHPDRTLAGIRQATGLPASTCNRLVQNLVSEGVLERGGEGYRIGARVLHWSAAAVRGRDIVTVLTPVIERLRDATGESAAIFVRQGLRRTCVAVAPTRHAVIWQLHVGMSTPLHVGSGGRAILAFDSAAIEDVLSRRRNSFTKHTITGAKSLRVVLAGVRETGVAISDQELDDDVAGVSAPVFGTDRDVLASLTVAGPAQRFTSADVERYVPELVRAAQEASALFGGQFDLRGGK